MKKTFYPMAMALTLLATSCSSIDDIVNIDDADKDMISFSLSDGSRDSRVGFRGNDTHLAMRIESVDRTNTSDKVYTRTTGTAVRNESEEVTAYSTVKTEGNERRFWDDAHGRKSLLSVYAIAIPNAGSGLGLVDKLKGDATWSSSNSDNTVTWSVSTSQTKDVKTKENSGIVTSTSGTIDKEDLAYSNNIQADATLGKDGVYRWNYTKSNWDIENTGAVTHKNGQMLFYQSTMNIDNPLASSVTDAAGHFDRGHLVFHHALSRMTITLVEGEGYNSSSTADFKFTKEGTNALTNISLLGMNTKGTLNLATGVWTLDANKENITKIACPGNENTTVAANTFVAQMLPGYEFAAGGASNVMKFTIDDNTYYITQDMLFKALKDNAAVNGLKADEAVKYVMEQGKNYKFTITVKKTGIESITATLVDWVDVEANYAIDNSHVSISTKYFNGAGDAPCNDFSLYRYGKELSKIYTDASYINDPDARVFSGDYDPTHPAVLTETTSDPHSHIWNTKWYYENNKTAYNFRTVNTKAKGTLANDASSVTFFHMTSGDQANHDYHWGAPMKTGTSTNLAYNIEEKKGFEANIHSGIVSPSNTAGTPPTISETTTVNITEIHMMSNVNIKLTTDTNADGTPGPGAVNLKDAVVTLTRFAKEGNVDMGTGFITPAYNATDANAVITAPAFDSNWETNSKKAYTDYFTYAVVPQLLRRTTAANPAEADCVGLTIRTIDNNEYYVIKDLATIVATSVTDERNQHKDDAITRWFPGHNYNYTIKITKKGIEAITCTIAEWVNVEAKQIEIDLEN